MLIIGLNDKPESFQNRPLIVDPLTLEVGKWVKIVEPGDVNTI